MPRVLLRVALSVAVLLAPSAVAATPYATSLLCPRGLDAVLHSPACNGHRLHLLSAPRTMFDADTAGDVCVDSLRLLLATAATSMPCVANLDRTVPHGRQLTTEGGPFKGKLKCKFDTAAPLNVSDLSQGFIVECEEVTGPYNYLWVYIVLGVIGGCVVLFGLCLCVPWFVSEIKYKIDRRRDRRRQEAIDKAARIDKFERIDKTEKPTASHPYVLA